MSTAVARVHTYTPEYVVQSSTLNLVHETNETVGFVRILLFF